MSLLSPKMASKRPSAGDTIFPPKKRALYEHMKLHGIDKFSTNHITTNGILDYKENLGMYGMKIPVNIEIAQSENFSRARSDSLHSQLSSNSDNTENGSAGSRETSPCTIQSMFDHHTPERNPITSLDGLKPDISKPLFPPSDSDNSMMGSEGNLSPDNSSFGEQGETKSDKYERQGNKITFEQQADFKSIPENNVKTFHENDVRKNYSFQKEIIPEIEREELSKNGNSSIEQTRNDVYMGPMVSLLNRFNAEAAQNNMDLKIKEQLSLQEMRTVLPPNSLIRPNVILNYSQQHFEALHHIQNSIKTQSMPNKINKVPSEKKSCHLCNKEFTSRANLHNHLKTHENKSIPCWVCKEMFQTAENLNAHMKIEHKGENPYKCEHCSREFTQFNNLRRHMRVHREKVFKCNLCNREFNEEFYLKMHMGTHTGKRVYSCGVCGAGFPSSHDLKMHVKTHSPSLLHTCDVCGKSFSKACVLRQHKKGHSGERPHKCDKCEKTFIHRHHLTMHMKSHVDEKRLSCDICQKEFSQHSHLYKHLRAHEELKKFDVDLESARKKSCQNTSVKKKDVSKGHNIIAKSVPKVVLNPDNVSSNDREFVTRDIQVISDANVIQTTGKTPKQRRNNISQNSQVQLSYSASMSSPFSDNSKSLPSMSQTFGHQMSRYPSMPYGQRISHNYLPGSQAQPFSPLYNPLLSNGVPAPLHGFQPYNQLYRNYSEQVQTYYNNMYMMKYLSQNALLQKGQGEGQNFKNGDFQLPKHSESRDPETVQERPSALQPKIIKGIESIGNDQVSNEKEENTQRETGIEKTVSENEGNGDLDVVNEGDENIMEESQDMGRDFEVDPKDNTVMSEEHEVAQELLKMSAGTKMIDSHGNSSKLSGKGEIQETDSKVNGMKFRHCISDIIERTVRNGNKLSENMHVSNSQSTCLTASNCSPFDSVSRSNEHFQVTIPKTIDQPFQVDISANTYVRYSSGHERETEQDINLEPTNMNRISESQTSPLQKLKMFVASEEKDFNRNVVAIDDSRKYDSAFHSYAADKVQERLESMHEENNFEEKPDGDLLENGENIVKAIEASHEEVRETGSETVKSVEDSLEVRLEKIRQFADIGKRFGKSVSESEILENGESEETADLIEGKEDSVVDNGNEAREIDNENAEIKEDKPVVVVLVDSVDNASYFDDSLEDRQLEIVENDIARGEENDELEDQGPKRTSELVETNNVRLNISTGEGYVFTENEFLSHITQMNDVVENGEGNVKAAKKATEEINEGNETDCETVEYVTIDKDENLIGQVKSQQLNEVHNCVNLNSSVKEHLNEDVEKYRIEPFEKSFDGNAAEYEAVDLRTEIRSDESKINEVSFSESDVSRNVELENLPMDLSMSGTQRKSELGNQVDRSGGSREGICHSRNNKVGSPASLTCGLCWRTFLSVHELELHQIEHAKSIGNHCSICKKSFAGAFELQCHILKHKDLSTFIQNKDASQSEKPENRGKYELSFSGQKEHVERLHNLQVDRRESLEFSQSEMNQRSELSQSSEMGEKQYTCQFCDKTFDQSEEWVEHVNTHNASDKPYVCNICRRAFTHRHNLNRHKMSHNSKSYECNVCKRSFKESFYLQMHMKIHDEENFHKCQICGQNVRKSEIWQHTSQHLGNMSENPTYHQIGNRVQQILHEQNVNPNDEKAGVNSRSKQFNVPDETVNGEDMRKIKSDKFGVSDQQGDKALNLKKENIENWNVQRNAKIDQYDAYNVFRVKVNALKSASVLTERRSEDSHQNSGGNSLYECHICKTVLRTKHILENHMGIHSGLRPHVCKTCGRAFKKSKGLRTHEKLHLEPSLQV